MSNIQVSDKIEDKLMKTGTTCLALTFNGGVIMAADNRVSAGFRVGKVTKINMLTKEPDDNLMGMAIAGLASDGLSLVDLMRSELKLYKFENGYPATTKVAANLLGVILHSSYRRYQPYWSQLLVAGQDNNGGGVYTIDPSGAVSRDDYFSIGSGSLFALSKIEDGWRKDISKEDAKKLAIRAIKLAASRDLYSGDGIDVFVITKDGVEKEHIDLPNVLDN